MRKIKTKSAMEKQNRKNQMIVSGIIISLLLFSMVGFALLSGDGIQSSEKRKYNDVEFILNPQTNLWEFSVAGKKFSTQFAPWEVEEIQISEVNLNYFIGNVVYFVPDNPSAVNELFYNFYEYIIRTQEVCLEGEECLNENLVIKDCSDKIIIFRDSEESEIRMKDNCLIIYVPYENQIMASDRIIFKALGIQ